MNQRRDVCVSPSYGRKEIEIHLKQKDARSTYKQTTIFVLC